MKTTLTCIFAGLYLISASAQTNMYTLSTTTGVAYESLTDATNLTEGTTWDDPQLTFPLGFEFEFWGEIIQNLYIEDLFYGGILSTTESEIGVTPLLVAYGSDLIDRGDLTGIPESPILWKVEGDPGSRIFKAEWKNAGYYEEQAAFETSEDFINFQLWLYEGSNVIELRFGPYSIQNDSLAFDGLQGPIIGLMPSYDLAQDEFETFWVITGNPDAPVFKSFDSNTEPEPADLLIGHPSEGTVYRFSPVMVSTENRMLVDEVRIFPTITSGLVSLQLPVSGKINLESLEIRNMQGQVVSTKVVSSEPSQILDISDLAAGIYLVVLKDSDESVYSRRIIKQ